MDLIRQGLKSGCLAGLTMAMISVAPGAEDEKGSPEKQPSVSFHLAVQGLPDLDPKSNTMWKSTPALADFNKDGLTDLAVFSRLGDGARVWFGDGKGNWQDASQGLAVSNSCGGGLAAGDVNNDGHLDLAIADHCEGVSVYLGDGQGRWQLLSEAMNPERAREVDVASEGENTLQGAEDLAVGDINGDSFLDIVASGSDEGGFTVYLGDGSGKSWKDASDGGLPTNKAPDPGDQENGGWANQVRLHDVNGDGHLDVIAGYYSGPRVWWGDGKGHWQDRSEGLPRPMIGGLFRGLAVGDVNGDGHLDLAVANSINGPEIFLQEEDGSWQTTPDVMPTMRGGAKAVALGDLNGDDHLDLMVGGRLNKKGSDYGLFALRGDGKGGWTEFEGTKLPATGLPIVWGVSLGSINGDDLPDLAAATGTGGFAGKKQDLNPDEEILPLIQIWINQHGG